MQQGKSYFSGAFSGTSSGALENLSIKDFQRPFFCSSICCTLPIKLKQGSRLNCGFKNHNRVCNVSYFKSVPDKNTLHSSRVTPVKLVSFTRGNWRKVICRWIRYFYIYKVRRKQKKKYNIKSISQLKYINTYSLSVDVAVNPSQTLIHLVTFFWICDLEVENIFMD